MLVSVRFKRNIRAKIDIKYGKRYFLFARFGDIIMLNYLRGVYSVKLNSRIIIFALVLLAVGTIFAAPYLSPVKPKISQFTVTPEPDKKLAQAAAAGKPVFLEFYSLQ